jgi:hypothetical protein
MRAKLTFMFAFAFSTVACAANPSGTDCDQGVAKLRECGLQEWAADFQAGCSPSKATELAGLDCAELTEAFDGAKADVIGWKKYGESCSWNFQCSGTLTCRPVRLGRARLCLGPGHLGEACDAQDDADCSDGVWCIGIGTDAATHNVVATCQVAPGDRCSINFSCSGTDVCRPLDPFGDQFCQPPGEPGDYCNTGYDSDCDTGLGLVCEAQSVDLGLCEYPVNPS